MTEFDIRAARPEDCDVLAELIRGLAEYEKLSDACHASAESLRRSLFGSPAECYALIGWTKDDNQPVGFALYFYNYSTFLTQKGLYLEDIFVKAAYRGKGLGKSLMRRLAQIAIEEHCGRFEWSVLDWNTPAIDFYESLGANVMPDWRICRLTGAPLTHFATKL